MRSHGSQRAIEPRHNIHLAQQLEEPVNFHAGNYTQQTRFLKLFNDINFIGIILILQEMWNIVIHPPVHAHSLFWKHFLVGFPVSVLIEPG